MADFKHIFTSWQKVVGDEGDPWENEEDMMFMFDTMPRTGEGLENICQGHPHGEEVLKRLKRFFRDAAVPSEEEGETPFSQARLPRKSDKQIRELLLQHAANIRQMAVLAADDPDNDEIVKTVGNPPELTRVDSSDDIEPDHELRIMLDIELPDLFNDRVAKVNIAENPLFYLTEALYHAAWNHYAVAEYVQWPIRKGKSTLEDPYLPKYELWLQNVTFCYTGNGQISYAVDKG